MDFNKWRGPEFSVRMGKISGLDKDQNLKVVIILVSEKGPQQNQGLVETAYHILKQASLHFKVPDALPIQEICITWSVPRKPASLEGYVHWPC